MRYRAQQGEPVPTRRDAFGDPIPGRNVKAKEAKGETLRVEKKSFVERKIADAFDNKFQEKDIYESRQIGRLVTNYGCRVIWRSMIIKNKSFVRKNIICEIFDFSIVFDVFRVSFVVLLSSHCSSMSVWWIFK